MHEKTNEEIAKSGVTAVAEYTESTGYESKGWDQMNEGDKQHFVKVVEFIEKNPDATPETIHENTKPEGVKAYSELPTESAIAVGTFIAKVKEELFGSIKPEVKENKSQEILQPPTVAVAPEIPENGDHARNVAEMPVQDFKNHASNPPCQPGNGVSE